MDSVGDATHCTFSKCWVISASAIILRRKLFPWAWEYVTQYLKIPPSRLWVTVFRDDDEAFEIWRQTGVPENRIVRLGESDNFWDRRKFRAVRPLHRNSLRPWRKTRLRQTGLQTGCDCKRYTEIWNLVFTQFYQDESGKRTNLPKPNIDTGMGLERVTTIMQGKTSMYETNVFVPLLQKVTDCRV